MRLEMSIVSEVAEKRGALTASTMVMLKSSAFRMTCSTPIAICVAPGAPMIRCGLPSLKMMLGTTELKRALPGAAGPRVEHAHAAVVHEAQARRDHARRHAQRMGHGEAVAVLVEYRDVRGVLGDGARVEARHAGLHAAHDLAGHGLGIGFRGQLLDRHGHELG